MQLLYLQNTVYDPMLVPPLPWRSLYFGGHLLQREIIVRLKSKPVQLEALYDADSEHPGLQKVTSWLELTSFKCFREDCFMSCGFVDVCPVSMSALF